MGKKLLLVESPTKAKTIQRFVDKDTVVRSTYGHIRDLPKSTLGIAVEENFEPKYIIPKKASPVVKELKTLASKAEQIYLATDPDREGEAIAWHITEALDLNGERKSNTHRITFHEITDAAIQHALEAPRSINADLVDAQQARRVLDRLVGYELSPLLWKKIYRGLSAGRVQSAALRLIVDREEEINAFKAQEYWSLVATFITTKKETFVAKLEKVDGKALAKYPPQSIIKKAAKHDETAGWEVGAVIRENKQRHPYPPFTTSTLQQESSRKLHFSAKQTMALAQKLYEGISIGKETVGLITYMRTDSVVINLGAIKQARAVAEKTWGKTYISPQPRFYKTKSKGAQEAHEAVRPTSFSRTPDSVKKYLSAQEHRLYTLIWNRAIASQMASAQLESTQVHVELASSPQAVTYVARGIRVAFPGFLKVYDESLDDNQDEDNQLLPNLKEKDSVTLDKLEPKQHFTQPPPRYNDASLIKEMEKRGIGRPSTYAPTLSTITERGYVVKQENKFMPQEVGFIVIKLLKEKFPSIVDLDFTAQMEEKLDDIAEGDTRWQPVVKEFYSPFKKLLTTAEKDIESKSLSETQTDEKCPNCGKPLIIKLGRFGKFYACTGFPECRYTRPHESDPKLEEKEEKLIEGRKCPKDGGNLVLKSGRFGTFIGCANYPNCKHIEAIKKEIGVKCPEDGGEIVELRTKRGKPFWGCGNYPKCKFASWDKPTSDPCPKCKGLVVDKRGVLTCTSCDYKSEGKKTKEKIVKAER